MMHYITWLLLFTLAVKSEKVDFICIKKGTRPVNGVTLSTHPGLKVARCAFLCVDDSNCDSFIMWNADSASPTCELRDQSGEDQHTHVDDRAAEFYARKYKIGDCADIKKAVPGSSSGVYSISLDGYTQFQVYCEFNTDDGGWLIFQKRSTGNLDFYKMWEHYAAGFGDLQEEFWLGNRLLHRLTSERNYTLKVYLEDFEGESRYAEYSSFFVGPESDQFRLSVGGYSGDAGDALWRHNGKQFTTRDQDNDDSDQSCAQVYKGAWWYYHCHTSNLNGEYLNGTHQAQAEGVIWFDWKGYYYSLKTSIMMLRPTDTWN